MRSLITKRMEKFNYGGKKNFISVAFDLNGGKRKKMKNKPWDKDIKEERTPS